MATEAQRLMMMSLGKIQGCRNQRGGINLYKSLLVTKVLYRARSVALTEHASPKKEVEEEDQRVPEVVMSDAHVVPAGDDVTQQDDDQCDFYSEDKENSKPVDNSTPHNEPVDTPEDFTDNNKPSERCQSPARCVKRRLTEVEQAVESISPKRQKVEDNDTQNHPVHEPMQVEQISSLVNRFSSGFTGLLASDSDNYNSEDDTEEEGQGHSGESSLLSCSTQIKESFELLARPIALSVWTIR